MAVGESTFALGTKLIFPFSMGVPSTVAVPERLIPDGPQATKVLRIHRNKIEESVRDADGKRDMSLVLKKMNWQ
ncbi:MAG: hypothetical protein ACF8AM_03380 [Rhodopirellula sp. JB055]|uniref:hypothetical protein n=1 Tax=Rhodopirellula sp. JB055 TaxID=3342846 RepID=UPI00370AB33A